jgi:hypothetical protein
MLSTVKITICLNGFKIGVLEIPRHMVSHYLPLLDKEIRLESLPIYYYSLTQKVIEDNPLVRLVYID